MTLLRRAPREVYRVYGEHEFLADACHDEGFAAVASETGPRRLHRMAGATMLLAAMGAVGGLIALTSLSSVARGGRRVRADLLAATGSLISSRAARAHVWRERAGSGAPGHQSVRERQADRIRSARSAATRPRAAAVGLRHPLAPIEAPAPAPIEAPPASVARLTARASSALRQPGQSEFGFER
jgi:hypothetical protein